MFHYFGLAAKIDAASARLLNPGEFAALAEAPNLREMLDILQRNPAYAALLSGYELGAVTRTAFEKIMVKRVPQEFSRFIQFSAGATKNFMTLLLRRYEVQNIKLLMKSMAHGGRDPSVLDDLTDLGPYAGVDLRRLREATSMPDIVGMLDRTSYHHPLSDAMPAYQADGRTYPLESALDYQYIRALWKASSLLPSYDREKARRFLGIEGDLLNIQWLYRGKFYYGMSSDEVMGLALNVGWMLSSREVYELAASAAPDAFASALAATRYAGLADEAGRIDPARFDVLMRRRLYREARATRSGMRFNIGGVMSYLFMIESEVRDVTALAECVHYGIPQNERSGYLVRGAGVGG